MNENPNQQTVLRRISGILVSFRLIKIPDMYSYAKISIFLQIPARGRARINTAFGIAYFVHL